jgi:hypothetical protein
MVAQIEHPTRWRWTVIEEEQGSRPGEIRLSKQSACAVYLSEYGSWFRTITVFRYAIAYSTLPSDKDSYEDELQFTPAYTNGDPDTEAWGPVEEHGFECMGLPDSHTHDGQAVKWMNSVNRALNSEFLLGDFE